MIKFINNCLTRLVKRKASGYENVSFGRNAGWWLLIGQQKIGELEYVGWDENSQFWHEYKINLFDKQYHSITQNPDHWYSYQITIQNKNSKYPQVHKDYIPAIRNSELVAMRGLFEVERCI